MIGNDNDAHKDCASACKNTTIVIKEYVKNYDALLIHTFDRLPVMFENFNRHTSFKMSMHLAESCRECIVYSIAINIDQLESVNGSTTNSTPHQPKVFRNR